MITFSFQVLWQERKRLVPLGLDPQTWQRFFFVPLREWDEQIYPPAVRKRRCKLGQRRGLVLEHQLTTIQIRNLRGHGLSDFGFVVFGWFVDFCGVLGGCLSNHKPFFELHGICWPIVSKKRSGVKMTGSSCVWCFLLWVGLEIVGGGLGGRKLGSWVHTTKLQSDLGSVTSPSLLPNHDKQTVFCSSAPKNEQIQAQQTTKRPAQSNRAKSLHPIS